MSTEAREIKISHNLKLSYYRDLDHTENDVETILQLGHRLRDELGTRRIWMLSASEYGNSEIEIIPSLCRLLGDTGVDARWLVLENHDEEFLAAVRNLNDLLYGFEGENPEELKHAFDDASASTAEALQQYSDPRDIVVGFGLHMAGLARALPADYAGRLVWYCDIGNPRQNDHSRLGWETLAPYLEGYAKLLFSEQRFMPPSLRERGTVITPGIDPLNHKNRPLPPYKLMGILAAAGIHARQSIPEWADFSRKVKVLRNNDWKEDVITGLSSRPILLQLGRFHAVKGFDHLLNGFHHLLKTYEKRLTELPVNHQRLAAEVADLQLVLAGPDPFETADDPHDDRVIQELAQLHSALPPDIAKRVHVIRLPMGNRKEYFLTINALQRIAAVVVQNSLAEGPGVAIAEVLWKETPVLASDVGGVGLHIRPDIDGVLIPDPRDPEAVSMGILQVLGDRREAEARARSARKRVVENFLVLHQIGGLLKVFRDTLESDASAAD